MGLGRSLHAIKPPALLEMSRHLIAMTSGQSVDELAALIGREHNFICGPAHYYAVPAPQKSFVR